MNYSYKKTKEILDQNSFNFKKKFGQNFIVDENIIDAIVSKSLIDKDTLVIEIGPGAGSLTYKLADYAKNVLCYEIDESLKDILKENLKDKANVDIIFKDFLKSDVKKDIAKYEYSKLYIVANLPYYITTPIVVKVIEDDLDIDKMVIMVQKEVGDRFKAMPGSKDYNSLSIFINYHFNTKKLLDVSRNVFMPVPNVDSIVISFEKKENRYELTNKQFFFKLVRDSFKQKRKTLKNNLKDYNLEIIENVLSKHNLNLSVRAEELSIEIFVEIANELVKYDR